MVRPVLVALVTLVAAVALGSCSTGPEAQPTPSPTGSLEARERPRPERLVHRGPPQPLRVLQYNIQYADAGLRGVARDIRAADADVVLLNEVDDRRPTGGVLQARWLARHLGMAFAYDPNGDVAAGWRGNAVLTRLDIAYVRRFDLPRPEGTEQRGLMEVVVTDGRIQVDVWTTHLDPNGGTVAQARRIRRTVGDPTCATVLGGDLNRRADLAPVRAVGTHLRDLWPVVGDGTFGGTNRSAKRRIDYLMTRHVEPVALEVLPRAHSDHRRLVGDLVVDPRRNC